MINETIQILCVITEYLVNIMVSLFTPTSAFVMGNDEMFEKYKEQSKGGVKMEEAIKMNGEACWLWLTSKESLEKAGRPTSLVEGMLTREIGEELDEVMMTMVGIGSDANHMMVTRSPVWREGFKSYVEKLKEVIDKKYTMELCEKAEERQVNQTIWRKIEWVMMFHRSRRERPFPLLTKSLLPRLGDVLSRVKNAIAEVSCYVLRNDFSVCLCGSHDVWTPPMTTMQCAEDPISAVKTICR